MEKKKERQNIIIPRTKYFTTRYFIFLGGCVGEGNRRKTCSILTYIRVVEKFPATIYASLCILPPPPPPSHFLFALYYTYNSENFRLASPVDNVITWLKRDRRVYRDESSRRRSIVFYLRHLVWTRFLV